MRAELTSVTIYCDEEGNLIAKVNVKPVARKNIPGIIDIATKHGDQLAVDIARAVGITDTSIDDVDAYEVTE